MLIVNLTQHPATAEQIAAGVADLPAPQQETLRRLLTFDELPDADTVRQRAEAIAKLAADTGARRAMIGGAPYLMAPLENALWRQAVVPVYAFSRRESAEEMAADGAVKKVTVFRHTGFVEAVGGAPGM